jgi:hypothetical protein
MDMSNDASGRSSAPVSSEPETETPESLEGSGKQHYNTWIKQRLRLIAIGLGCALFAVVVTFWVKPLSRPSSGDAIETLINAPTSFMDFALRAVCVGAFVIGMGMTLSQVGKILRGPPKAGTTAEQTVRQFYSHALVQAGTLTSSIDLEAFVCLLNRAKKELGEWTGFCEYWKQTNSEIVKALHARSKHPVKQAPETRREVKSVNIVDGPENRASYVVTVAFTAVFDQGCNPLTGARITSTFGPYLYSDKGDIMRVGSRWYLCSGKWSGTTPEERQEATQKERYQELGRILASPRSADLLANRMVKTIDGAFMIYQDRDLNSPNMSPATGTEIQLGASSIIAEREWVEATLPNGNKGYAFGANVRGHSA